MDLLFHEFPTRLAPWFSSGFMPGATPSTHPALLPHPTIPPPPTTHSNEGKMGRIRAPLHSAGGRVGGMRHSNSGGAAVGPALAVREAQGGGAGRVVFPILSFLPLSTFHFLNLFPLSHLSLARPFSPLPATLFTVLVVAWVVCGTVAAAGLLWDRHSQYERHREEALGVWCKERALMLQQLVLAHAGQMQTLAGLISVMGKPGQGGKWEMGKCLNGSMWVSYLTRTAPTRPGNTGAVACAVVRDAERAAFERQYGSIRENTLIVSARRPIYCPKVLELTTLYATDGPSNIDMFQRYHSLIPLVEAGRHLYSWPYPLANPLTHAGFGEWGKQWPSTSVPTNHSSQLAVGAVYGSIAATFDVTYIAQKVLEELYEPDPSKSFELYDITDPTTLFAIVSPVPPHAYFRPDDKLPYMHPSSESETRPWEQRAVVPLEEMGAGVRKYEVWCRGQFGHTLFRAGEENSRAG
ncbi:unnamed protein product [Closterium sp. Yama58-4]|nr:unnamed protein product [Closterium sp. Yama58-4]